MANKGTQFGQPNGNEKHELTEDDARKGGINSGKARREKKSWAEILERIGNLPVKSEKNKAIMRDAGITDEEMISDVQKLFRLNMKADSGDPKAIEMIAKIRGELRNININENYNLDYKPIVDLTQVRKKNGENQDQDA